LNWYGIVEAELTAQLFALGDGCVLTDDLIDRIAYNLKQDKRKWRHRNDDKKSAFCSGADLMAFAAGNAHHSAQPATPRWGQRE
jgi:hypothetical protein